MNTGQIISGAGHLALIGWAVFGGALRPDPPPVEVVEAVTISSEEFAAMTARQSAPGAVANVDTPEPPAAGETAPALSPEAEAAPEARQPAPTATPPPDARPVPPERPAPAPADLADAPPALDTPAEDMAALVPEVSPRPAPRAAPRVAPETVAPPEPETQVDDTVREEVTPETGEAPERDPQEATAPEAAATEIVTEAEEAGTPAPPASRRPRARPEPPAQAAQDPAAPEPSAPATDRAAIDEALAAALGQAAQTPERAAGPPLTAGEKDALRVAVQRCWNVGSLSSDALATTVTVAVSLSRSGTPEIASIRKLDHSGGGEAAARQAFEAARRAIIRCGADGFDLPAEKYARWRDIEMTFNPETMRIK
ncbi:MAG TPA: energy transducer TonB [Paracoccaceae bacterium]|nr:energy transducer TonB [Paracoccaceae bacterium]